MYKKDRYFVRTRKEAGGEYRRYENTDKTHDCKIDDQRPQKQN